jgi:hypothetical protein
LDKVIISSEDRLLRRCLFLNSSFIKPDGTPTSGCFSLKRDEDGLSVDLEKLTSFSKSIQDPRIYRLFVLIVGEVKSLGLDVVYDPIPTNIAHSLIKGNITKPISRQLAGMARRINYPE